MLNRNIGLALVAAAGVLCAASGANADTVVYSNHFASNAAGFASATLTTAPNSNQFLYFEPFTSNTLTVGGLAPHGSVKLSFDLYAIGSLDGYSPSNGNIPGGGTGDYFSVNYSGSYQAIVFNKAFANYGGDEVQNYPLPFAPAGQGASALNGLGYSGFPSVSGIQDAEYSLTLSAIPDSSGTVSFLFTSNANQGTGDEFYGIDNVVVTTDATNGAVPEPATWAMMIAGMALVGVGLRQRKSAVAAA